MSNQFKHHPPSDVIFNQVKTALAEDLGESVVDAKYKEDVTANLLDKNKQVTANLISREKAVLSGEEWFNATFEIIAPGCKVHWQCHDGDSISEDQVICEITGSASSILTAERTALNFLQTLSATASQTAVYANKIKHTRCKILDTRKTIPGLRLAQKYAVACGGGINHRTGLFDMILIKENHILAAGSIQKAVSLAKNKYPDLNIEVEVENLDELSQALECQVDRILLDNMDTATLKQAVELTSGQTALEASGNITMDNLIEAAETGVDFISTGAITKNIRAIDFSLRLNE